MMQRPLREDQSSPPTVPPSAAFAGHILTDMLLPPSGELTILTVVDKLDMLPTLEEMASDGERNARQQWQRTRHREAEHLLGARTETFCQDRDGRCTPTCAKDMRPPHRAESD